MTARVYSYFRISDAQKKLAELYQAKGQNVIFLVPTTLDKDALTDIITQGKAIFGERPVIMTLAELYNKLAEEENEPLRVIDPPDHKLILKHIVKEYLTNCDTDKLPAGVKHKGFISLLSDNIHTLIRECVSPQLLYDKATCSLGEYEPESILHNLYKTYLEYLDKNSLIDSVQTPDKLLEIAKRDKAKKFLFAHTLAVVGFSSFTGNQLMLLNNFEIMEFEILYFMPRTGMIGKFRGGLEQLAPPANSYEKLKTEELKIKKLYANGQNLEFAAIAREIALSAIGKGQLFERLSENGNFNFSDIGILATAQTLDSVENELKRYKLPYFVSLRGTVADTGLGKLPAQIWAARSSGWDTEETAILLSDPLISPQGFNSRKYLEKFIQKESGWQKALSEYEPEKAKLFEDILTLCGKLSKPLAPSEILQEWKIFLDKLDVAATSAKLADKLPEYDFVAKNLAFALTELDKKIDILNDATKDIGAAADVTYSEADAVEYLLEWATTATLPIQLPQKNAIALYGATPPTFTQHNFWIMTDADGNSWPGKLKESPLLRKEQLDLINQKEEEEINFKTAHIPTMRDQREQKEMLFCRLLATAKQGAVVAVSTVDATGRPIPETAFMQDIFEKERNNFYEAPWKLIEPATRYNLANAMPKDDDVWFAGAEISENVPKNYRGAFPRTANFIPETPSISLSGLDSWIACPYRYWCRLVQLEQWNDSSFNRLLAGNLTHRLWELYWQTPKADRSSFTDFVRDNFDCEAVQSEYKALSSERLTRHKEQLKEQTEQVALLLDSIEPKTKAAGRIDTKAELNLKDSDGNDFEIDGVKIRGKVDRLDIYPDNKVVILDYKLNSAENHKEELQLAAYAYLLKELYDYEVIGYAWIGHKDGKLCGYFTDEAEKMYNTDIDNKCFDATKLKEKLAEAKTQLNAMVSAVKLGEYKANYDAKDRYGKNLCSRCDYASICRKRESAGYIEESEENAEQ